MSGLLLSGAEAALLRWNRSFLTGFCSRVCGCGEALQWRFHKSDF